MTDFCQDLVGRVTVQKVPGDNIYSNTITVACGDLANPVNVIIENTYPSNYTFNRDGDRWYLLHTCLCLDKEKWIHDTSTVFINLNTGETRKTTSLSFWRGSLQMSPNGKLAIIDAGITASSARQIMVIDLTDWGNVTIIYREEIWSYIDYDTRFDNDSNVVFEYILEFWILDDKVSLVGQGTAYNEEFCKYLWNEIHPGVEIEKYYSGSETDLLEVGGEKTFVTVKVTHARNPALITPDTPEKWNEVEDRWNHGNPDAPKKYKQVLESAVFLDEMEIIKTEKSVGVPKKRNNIKVDETNFEQFLDNH